MSVLWAIRFIGPDGCPSLPIDVGLGDPWDEAVPMLLRFCRFDGGRPAPAVLPLMWADESPNGPDINVGEVVEDGVFA